VCRGELRTASYKILNKFKGYSNKNTAFKFSFPDMRELSIGQTNDHGKINLKIEFFTEHPFVWLFCGASDNIRKSISDL